MLLNKVNNKVSIHWIPSHVGHLGNEVADRLAKRGAQDVEGNRTIQVPISVSNTKQMLNKLALGKHEERWLNSTNCRQSRMACPQVTIKNWKAVENLKGRQMKISTNMRTGHCVLNYHMANMRKLDSSLCHCDEGDEETVYHFIGKCPMWANIRHQIFTVKQFQDLNIHKILTFVEKTGRYEDFMT